ncbi:hypothetical protein ACFVXC_17600 [Streptomyces sp. NPDC058257]|uniref:hypothetical protein n=1 Tax=Streptomyces sp. NPDC058257 TaxID=3346409 RepID=UPI0036F06D71
MLTHQRGEHAAAIAAGQAAQSTGPGYEAHSRQLCPASTGPGNEAHSHRLCPAQPY